MTARLDLPFGGAIAYDDLGLGRSVVLVHGCWCSRAFFARNVGPLSERFRVINVDLPGHGESPPRDGGHPMEQYARDLMHLLSALDLQDPVLVGWSKTMASAVAPNSQCRRCSARQRSGMTLHYESDPFEALVDEQFRSGGTCRWSRRCGARWVEVE